jgi:hypothetical protein
LFGGDLKLNFTRIIAPVAFCAVCGLAQAQIAFSSVVANYTLNPGAITKNWLVTPNIPSLTIDFTQNAPPFKVGASTGFSTGSSSINYNVVYNSPFPLISMDLVLQGDVEGFGRIVVGETITSVGTIGSLSDTILGASWGGSGVDGAFTKVYHVTFSTPVNSFSVSQTLTSDINGQSLPSGSLALVAIDEHNYLAAVPEPASLSCLALGALALLRRRRS